LFWLVIFFLMLLTESTFLYV